MTCPAGRTSRPTRMRSIRTCRSRSRSWNKRWRRRRSSSNRQWKSLPGEKKAKYCVTHLLTVSRHMYRTCSSDFSPDIFSLNLFLWALLLSSSSSSSPLEDAPPAANATVARREDEEHDMASLKCRDFEAPSGRYVMPGKVRKSWTGHFSYLYPHG